LEILYAEKERRENFSERIDWNDPKEKPEGYKKILLCVVWDPKEEDDEMVDFGFWNKATNCWVYGSNREKFYDSDKNEGRIYVKGWVEMPQGPKGSFSTKQKKKEVYMGALDEKMK